MPDRYALIYVGLSGKFAAWFSLGEDPSIWISFVASMALLASVPGSMGYIVSISMTMGADAKTEGFHPSGKPINAVGSSLLIDSSKLIPRPSDLALPAQS